jgi:hypothetical protein
MEIENDVKITINRILHNSLLSIKDPFKTVIPKLSKFPLSKLSKFLFSKLSKFSFPNCQNFIFQTVKISFSKLSKFLFSKLSKLGEHSFKIMIIFSPPPLPAQFQESQRFNFPNFLVSNFKNII